MNKFLEALGLSIQWVSEPKPRGRWWSLCLSRKDATLIHLRISTKKSFCHAYIEFDRLNEEPITVTVAVPGVALWLGISPPWEHLTRWLRTIGRNIETGIHIHLPNKDDDELIVHWRVHSTSNSWDSRTPRWRDGRWNVTDTLFGEATYKQNPLREETVEIPLPERTYRWKVKLYDHVTSRKRWLFPKIVTVANFECEEGEQIPIPGKGESDYDLDDDAIFGMSCHSNTVPEAITKLVKSVCDTRNRRGWDWGATPEVRASQ